MSLLVPVALFGWLPLVLVLFMVLPPRRAVIVAFVGGWLFLPMAGYRIPALPDYTKVTATHLAVLLGALLFDAGRVFSFRPRPVDLPMLVWIACPVASSLANGLGPYDGLSAATHHLLTWGVPYLIGRVYFDDWAAVRELAVGIFIGGLIYVPLCLYEVRMSPQLHRMVYGFNQLGGTLIQARRMGGWRPTVFMQHGLMVSMWMTVATVVGFGLWQTRSLQRLWGIPTGYLLAALGVTTLLCRSLNAMLLLGLGLGLLMAVRWLRHPLPLACLLALAPAYMVARATGTWGGEQLVALAGMASEERADSVATRVRSEDLLTAKALRQPLFGWGGWSRSRVFDEDTGRDLTITDGLWVIALGENGLTGLVSLTLVFLMPGLLLWWRYPAGWWTHPALSPAVALAAIIGLTQLDNLMNAMLNPLIAVSIGALSGFLRVVPRPAAPAPMPAAAAAAVTARAAARAGGPPRALAHGSATGPAEQSMKARGDGAMAAPSQVINEAQT